ncbi:MAG: ABC transporter ATP-binding protein [Muribaculaceae bacterium]|jgi:iron complex transport system ATP-binding protein
MNDTVLRLEDVAVGYGSAPLYEGVSLRVSRGELVTLLGANGAGKSTLLRCVTGRLAPMRGLVEVAGRSLSEIPPRELARLVSIVSTGRELAGALTVAELVALGRQPHTGFFGRLSRHDREVVGLAMAAVGMEGFAQRQVASLSDGERQKVMIARALAQETPLVVLDEPTAFLDVASRLETMQLLSRLAREEGKAVILSSHDVGSALRLSQRLWLIADSGVGRTLVDGSPDSLIKSGALGSLFRGRPVRFSEEAMDFIPS